MKKIFTIIIIMSIALSMVSCSASETPADNSGEKVSFTDSCGRTVEIDENISRVAVSGPLAQNVVLAICPESLVGIASEWENAAIEYIDPEYAKLPILGQIYGGKGEVNKEELIAAQPQIVIDIGEPKAGIAEDMDELTEQTGIPFVHIDSNLAHMDETFEITGKLLGKEDAGNQLAEYWRSKYELVEKCVADAEKPEILYITGSEGMNVIAKGSYHGEVIDMFTENIAVVDEPSAKGSGNEVDMEQLLLWNPDYILFGPDSIFDQVSEDKSWQNMKAIADGNYYQVPNGPYNWMGFPPSVQQMLGMLWMGKLFYPEACTYDLKDEVKEFYNLFFHYELEDEQYEELVKNSIGKAGL